MTSPLMCFRPHPMEFEGNQVSEALSWNTQHTLNTGITAECVLGNGSHTGCPGHVLGASARHAFSKTNPERSATTSPPSAFLPTEPLGDTAKGGGPHSTPARCTGAAVLTLRRWPLVPSLITLWPREKPSPWLRAVALILFRPGRGTPRGR